MTWLRLLIASAVFVIAAACAATESGNPTARGKPGDAGVREEEPDDAVRVGFAPGDPPVDAGTDDQDDGG